MSKCRFSTPCGICEIKSMSGIPYTCDLIRTDKLVEEDKTYTALDGMPMISKKHKGGDKNDNGQDA